LDLGGIVDLWTLVASFIFMAGWILLPDWLETSEVAVSNDGLGGRPIAMPCPA